jgi:hypothetical protein
LGSKSKPTRRKPSLKRTRALKRHNIDFSPAAYWSQQGELFLTPEVIPYAWAACRRGAFDGKAGFASSLDPTEFHRVWRERINQFINSGGEVVVPMAKVRGELIPVGMISIAYQENRAYPHAIWFPEASARIRLEIGVKFIVECRAEENALGADHGRDARHSLFSTFITVWTVEGCWQDPGLFGNG